VALYNEILVGRFNKFLAKMFSMKGSAPSPQLAGEITPAVNIFLGIENRALEGWYRYGIAILPVTTAAVQSTVRFRNPANSNRLIIFEKISFSTDGPLFQAVVLETQTTNADLAVVIQIAPNVSWDKRLNVGSGMILSTSPPAAALSLARIEYLCPAAGAIAVDLIVEEQAEIILSPGDAIQLRTTVVNQDLATNWFWRERFFEESEITV
jgi:hypothetical protein